MSLELGRRRIPTVDDGDTAALEYAHYYFGHTGETGIGKTGANPYRMKIMSRLALNYWMRVGRHWIQRSGDAVPMNGGFRWVDIKTRDGRMPPVDNQIGAGIRNLTNRLLKKEYEPSPRADEQKPDLQEAARLFRDILLWDCEDQQFGPRVDEPVVDDIATYGTAIALSRLDEPTTEMHTVASTSAQKCVGCGALYSDRAFGLDDIPRETLGGEGFMERLMGRSNESGDARNLGICPMCDQGSNLEKYDPSEEEALGGKDAWGRPLGGEAPKVQAIWQRVPFWEMYPENGGIVDTAECKVWGRQWVESMQWIEARTDAKVYDKLSPEAPATLLKLNPILGDPWFGQPTQQDSNVYGDHQIVREIVVERLPYGGKGDKDGLRWGRRIMLVGEEIAFNGPLERTVPDAPDVRIPTVCYAAGVAERVHGEFWGRTPVDDARPLNTRLNRLDYMVEQYREHGVTRLMLPDGVTIDSRQTNRTGLLNTINYTNASSNANWTPKDAVLFSQPLTGNAYMEERDRIVQAIGEILGPTVTEQGGSDGANSAKQLIAQAEQSAQKLNRMDAAHAQILTKLWRHHGDLIWAFRKEEGEFERKTEAGTYEKKSYRGTEILRQTKIELEAKGTLDKSLLQAEMAEKGYNLGFYGQPGTQDQDTIADLLELMGLPKLTNTQSIQVKRAKQAFSDFISGRVVPYVDTTIQDTWIWYQVLGKLWQGDEAVELQENAGWSDILRKLAGWERQLEQAVLIDQQQRAVYEGQDPKQWPAIQAKLTALGEAKNKAAQPMPGLPPTAPPAPPLPPPPAPPANGQFLPESLCDKLLQLWQGMLTQAEQMQAQQAAMSGQPVAAPQTPTMAAPDDLAENDPMRQAAEKQSDQQALLQFYAVVQECRLDAKAKSAGPAQPAAPGGSRTVSGNVPTPGQPVIPTPGTEPAMAGAM